MDKQELQKNIALYYSKLPPEAQQVFAKMEWLERVKQISERYALNEAQQETLATETTLVLLGIIHPEEYEETLKKEISIAPLLLKEIIAEIKGSILESIRPQLTDTFNKNNTEEEPVAEIEGELDDRFKKLPKHIQDAIGESNYQNTLYEISKKYGFTIEQMGLFEQAVVDIMLGLMSESEFERNIKNTLKLTSEEVVELINSINEKMLVKIKGKVMAPNTPTTEIKKEEMDVLHQAGIKIIEPDLSIPEISAPNNTKVIPDKVDVPIRRMFSQKFSDSVQSPTIKTEHKETNTKTEPPMKSYQKGVDPYREVPE